MSVKIIRSPEQHQRSRIFNTIKNLESLDKVSILQESFTMLIRIKHSEKYVPDFELKYCEHKKHYRVYIHIGHTTYNKQNAGYTFMIIRNGLDAAKFCDMYSLIHKNKANNKEDALAA